MLFKNSLLMGIAALGFTSIVSANIPDGEWNVTHNADGNGASIWYSVSDPNLAPITVQQETAQVLSGRSSRITKRRNFDCWHYFLDWPGTDQALNLLRDWARQGQRFCGDVNANKPRSHGYTRNGVYAYACVTRAVTCASWGISDIEDGIYRMDEYCQRYQASWWGWPGTNKLVGKADYRADVCVGPFE